MSDFDWQSATAWHGGAVTSLLAATETDILAGTAAGLFRSVDAGHTWQRDAGVGYAAVSCLAQTRAANALASHRVWLATEAGRLYWSNDGGPAWQPIDGWQFGLANAIALSLRFSDDHTAFIATPDGIYRTLNGGSSWQSANFGLLDTDVLCLACGTDFEVSSEVWAGTASGGLYRSRNAGKSWREWGEGLADAAVLCIAPGKDALWVGTEAGLFQAQGEAGFVSLGLDGVAVNDVIFAGEWLAAATTDGLMLRAGEQGDWQSLLAGDSLFALAQAAVSTPNQAILAGGVGCGIARVSLADSNPTPRVSNTGLSAHLPPLAVRMWNGCFVATDNARLAAVSDPAGSTWSPVETVGIANALSPSGLFSQPTAHAAIGQTLFCLKQDADKPRLERLANQPPLSEAAGVITSIQITADQACLIGAEGGAGCFAASVDAPWHRLALPGDGSLRTLHLTPLGELLALRIQPAGAEFSAEVWRLPALVLPQNDISPAWQLLMAMDALRTPHASLLVTPTPKGSRVYLAAGNAIAHIAAQADEVMPAPVLSTLTALAADARITQLIAAPQHLIAAANTGVFASSDHGATWQQAGTVLAGVPIVALSWQPGVLSAIALGGSVWQCALPS